ncbi:MAG: hypothetical protein B7Y05_23260, partial [Polynucleobacter sp. 24-46-87]
DLKLPHDDPLRNLIVEMLSVEYGARPSMMEVKSRLMECLRDYDIRAYESLMLYVQHADDAEKINSQAGWPYMDDLVSKINRLYEKDL